MTNEELVAKLKADIEALAVEVRISETRDNEDGVPHVTVANGLTKDEGAPIKFWPTLAHACEVSLLTAKGLCLLMAGQYGATLYWRMPPALEMEDGGQHRTKLYMRLSFAPRLNDPRAA